MDFIKKVFSFINISVIFAITTIGLRLFLNQISVLAKQNNCSYIELYFQKSNVPVVTLLFLIAGITAIGLYIFSEWNIKFWLKINLCINALLLSFSGVFLFFYYSNAEVRLIVMPFVVIYLVLYIAFRSMLRSGYKIEVVYEDVENSAPYQF